MELLELILASLYFMLPAYAANAVPRLAHRFRLFECLGLAKPVDGGKALKGKRIFGANKTWRGILVAPCAGTLVGFSQSFMWRPDFLPYANTSDYILAGFLLGTGAIVGDLLFAFLKRRVGKKEGSPWIPFDQLNFVIGALACISIFYLPSIAMIAAIVVISGILHVIANRIAYFLNIQKVKL